jgi:glycosyltransferase involved in cell wall biosynthesis
MKLSVIISCYNGVDTIATQLDALANQYWTEPWEVIVSDNGSTDGSIRIIERYRDKFQNFRTVDASARRGQAYAQNIAAEAATGDALAFCDADDEVAPGWVAALGEALSRYDFVASRFDYKKLNEPWVLETRPGAQENGLERIWFPPYLPCAGSCGLGVRKSIHEAVGGFDESLACHVDTDYCLKIQMTGVALRFVPEAVVHVRYRNTLRGIFHQASRWGEYFNLLCKRYQELAGLRNHGAWKRYVNRWKRLFASLLKCILVWGLSPLYVGKWKSVLSRLPKRRTKGDIGAMIWQLGWQIGQLKGIFKYWVPPA